MSAVDVPAIGGDSGVKLGQIVQLFPDFPPTLELEGQRFVKNGYAVTSDYDPIFDTPSAQKIYFTDKTLALNAFSRLAGGNGVMIGFNSTGVHRSEDGGHVWTLENAAFANGLPNFFITNNAGLWMGILAAGYYRSVDNGKTWLYAAWAAAFLNTPCAAWGANGTVIVNGQNATNSASQTYRSTENGLNFAAITSGALAGLSADNLNPMATNGAGRWIIFDNQTVVYSANNGTNWTRTANLISNTVSSQAAAVWTGKKFLVASLYYIATNPVTYQPYYASSVDGQTFSVFYPPVNLAGAINSTITNFCTSFAVVGNIVAFSTFLGDIVISYDGGDIWRKAAAPSVGTGERVRALCNNGLTAWSAQRWFSSYSNNLHQSGLSGVGFATTDDNADSYYMRVR